MIFPRTLKLLTALMLAVSIPALADDQAVMWLDTAGDGEAGRAVLLETDVGIEVAGLIARSRVSQRFFNNSGQWAEGRYVFPLPDDSAVDELTIRIGDRLIEGEIQERGEARQTYRRARAAGQAAGLVEQERANLFTTHVANIPPNQEIEVRIGFRQRVDFEHGRFSLHFPTSVLPRFVPGKPLAPGMGSDAPGGGWSPDTDRVPDASRISPPVQHPDADDWNPLRMNVALRADMPVSMLESSHHPIEREFADDTWHIRLAEPGDASGRDFELVWRPANPEQVHGSLFSETRNGHEHALLMLVPPAEFTAEKTPREVVLIVDTSGSMRGEAMAQARDSLVFALDRLGPLDRFNVMEFNHLTRSLFDAPVAASNANIARARQFVAALEAGGGTVMGPALERAMRPGIADEHLRQIVFMTDGVIANEDEVLDQIRREIGDSRLFTVGIGHGVNSQFLRDGARLGRGSHTRIADIAQVRSRMGELLSQLTRPVLHDIELHWPGEAEILPESLPDLYTGQPLVVSARADSLQGDLTVSARSDGRAWQQTLSLDGALPVEGVAAHWARHRIQQLSDRAGNGIADEQARARTLSTALDYGLLSSQTSLVAVDRTPRRSRDAALERHDLPTNLAHGRELEGFFDARSTRAMPETDGGSFQSALRGMLALLLVGLLLGHRRLARLDDSEGS